MILGQGFTLAPWGVRASEQGKAQACSPGSVGWQQSFKAGNTTGQPSAQPISRHLHSPHWGGP